MTPVWPNRDPIAESGGMNLYEFAGNDSANFWDLLGTEVPAPDSVDANPTLAAELAADDAAANAGRMTAQQSAKRIALCKAIHAGYDII
jgi:hypothetical protein